MEEKEKVGHGENNCEVGVQQLWFRRVYIARELQHLSLPAQDVLMVTQWFGLGFPLPCPHVVCFGLHCREIFMPQPNHIQVR